MTEKIRRTVVDSTEIKELLIGLITSDEVCAAILPGINLTDLPHGYSKTVVKWIKDYYDKTGKAPRKDIEKVYAKEGKGIEQAEGEIIGKLLTVLSDEYQYGWDDEKCGNTEGLILRAKEYLKKRSIETAIEKTQQLLELGKVDRAEDFITNFKPVFVGTNAPALSQSIATFGQALGEELEEPQTMISPWLIDGSISEIYGPRGIGKTWLALIIGICVSRGTGIGTKIGPWEVAHPGGTLYLDGEMGRHLMQKQLKLLKQGLTKQRMSYPFDLLTYDRFLEDRNMMLDLSKEALREEIYQYLKEHEKYNLLILDNVASLFPGLDEDKKQQWDPVNQWLLSIKALNVSTIFVHHAGKGGKQRGASGREDNINVILKLSQPMAYSSEQGAYFKIEFEKTRGIPPGRYLAPFTLRLVENGNEGVTWETKEVTSNKELIKALLLQGEKATKEIAELCGVTAGRVSQIKKELKQRGLLDRNGNCTFKGREILNMMIQDGLLEGFE